MKTYFIWGFLGSGKTTLINYLLSHVFHDKKVVILENESGGVSVDGAYLLQNKCIVKEMNSGCICCTLRAELPKTIQSIKEEYSPDILLVETSGVASIESIYRVPNLHIDGVLSLLDVTKYNLLMKLNPSFFIHQYEISPVVFLTKTSVEDVLKDTIQEIINIYSKNGKVIEDYTKLTAETWNTILHEAMPFRWNRNVTSQWHVCLNKSFTLDTHIDTLDCIRFVQYAMKLNRDSIFRAKGLLYDENGILCKYDIWETSYSHVPVSKVETNQKLEPFVTIWWDKTQRNDWIEWFELFFQTKEVECQITADEIDEKEIWTYMGGVNFEPSPEVYAMVKKMQLEALSICEPKIGFRLFPGKMLEGGKILIGKQYFNPKGIIKKYLNNCDAYTLLISTVGSKMNEWINEKHLSTDIMEAFIGDILGSVIVEAIAAKAVKQLEQILKPVRWNVTNSYSPGYCGWDVKEQQLLFSMLPPKICGVTLTDTCLMIPIKSISTVLGVGVNVEKKPYGCKICKKKDCYKRRLTNPN